MTSRRDVTGMMIRLYGESFPNGPTVHLFSGRWIMSEQCKTHMLSHLFISTVCLLDQTYLKRWVFKTQMSFGAENTEYGLFIKDH